MKRKIEFGLIILASIGLLGCGGGNQAANAPDPNRLEKALNFGPDTNTMSGVEQSNQISGVPLDQGFENISTPNLGTSLPFSDSNSSAPGITTVEEIPEFPVDGTGTTADGSEGGEDDFFVGGGSGGVNDGAEVPIVDEKPSPTKPTQVQEETIQERTPEELERIKEMQRLFSDQNTA